MPPVSFGQDCQQACSMCRKTSSASLTPNCRSSDQNAVLLTGNLRSNLSNAYKQLSLILLPKYGERRQCWRVDDRRLQIFQGNGSHQCDIINTCREDWVPASNPLPRQRLVCILSEFSFQPGMKAF